MKEYNKLFNIYNRYQNNIDLKLKGKSFDYCNKIYRRLQEIEKQIIKNYSTKYLTKSINTKNKFLRTTSYSKDRI